MLKPFEVLDFSLPMVTVIDVEIAVADPRPDCERVLILDWGERIFFSISGMKAFSDSYHTPQSPTRLDSELYIILW